MPVLSDPFASLFSSTAEFARLEEGLSGPGVTALFGLPPAGRMALAVQLSRRLGRPLCVVTAGEAEASRAAADLQALGLSAAVFPARDLLLRPIEGAGREYEYRRLAVLGGLVGSRVDAVCVPAEGLLQFTVPKAEFCANTLTLKPGMEIPQKKLAVRLFGAGLAVAGAVLVLFRVSPPVCLLLIFAGLAYTTAVEHWLKGQAERENENAI